MGLPLPCTVTCAYCDQNQLAMFKAIWFACLHVIGYFPNKLIKIISRHNQTTTPSFVYKIDEIFWSNFSQKQKTITKMNFFSGSLFWGVLTYQYFHPGYFLVMKRCFFSRPKKKSLLLAFFAVLLSVSIFAPFIVSTTLTLPSQRYSIITD